MARLAKEMRLTYSDYARLPETGKRYELHEGRLIVVPAPSPKHQIVLGNLFERLHTHVRLHHLGRVLLAPIDLILGPENVYQPDLLFVHRDRGQLITPRGIEGPPDLVVEILSPGTEARDRTEKYQAYFLSGIPEYWILDPEQQTLEVHIQASNRYQLLQTLKSPGVFQVARFAGLTFPFEDLWT